MGKRGDGEGSIRQTAKGWVGAVALGTDVKGKPVRKFVLRQTRAEVLAAIKELSRRRAANLPVTAARRTVESFMNEWLEVHVKPTNAPLTYRGYEQTSRMYIVPRLGKIPLDRLNGQEVQRCLNEATREGRSPASVKNINATLKTALSTAKKWQYVERNVAKDATPPKQKKFAAQALTVGQAEDLMRVLVGHRYEALIVVALTMGLRRGEVAGLRWSEIDFATRTLNVRTALQRIPGEGIQLQDVKSEKSHRVAPIPSLAVAALKRRAARQEEEREAAGATWRQDSDFVFTSKYGARLVIEEPTRELDKALTLAKLPHIRFHDLRHTTASLLLAKGVPMKIVQEIMGHASFQITMDTYSHLLPSQLRGAADTMNDLFERADVGPDSGADVGPDVGPVASRLIQ